MRQTLTRLFTHLTMNILLLIPFTMVMASTTSNPKEKKRAAIDTEFLTTNVSCFAGNDGTATVIAFGGTEPYTYAWSNGDTTSTADSLSANTYSVTITDATGQTVVASIQIWEPSELIETLVLTDTVLTCNTTTISASLGMEGGTEPYTYIWTLPFGYQEVGQVLTINAPGKYIYDVTDSKGCHVRDSFLIYSDNIPVIIMELLDSVSCNGMEDGAAQAHITGGQQPYQLLWSNGATTEIIENLGSGAYTLTVTDAAGCTGQSTIFIPQAGQLSIELQGSNITCFGQETGVIMSHIIEGVEPFEYLWSNLATSANLINVPAGVYTLTVTDAAGCQASASIELTEGTPITIFTSVEHVTCFAYNNGLATAVAFGGSGQLTYNWSNGATGQIINNLLAGSYTVFVVDTNNCLQSATVTVQQPELLTMTLSATPEHLGNSDGTAIVIPAGGTPPYTYLWSNGETTQQIVGLTEGTYFVTVTDNNQCTNWDSIDVYADNCAFDATLTIHHVSCFGGNDAIIIPEITVTGSEPYYYLWSDGSSGVVLNNLSAGTYSVTITDNANCMVFLTGVVTQPNPINVNYNIKHPTGLSNPTGEITFTLFGGAPPFTIEINGQTQIGIETIIFTDLLPGNYTAKVKDSRNCEIEINFKINQIDCTISAEIEEINRPICNGDSNGALCVNFGGNNGQVIYQWSTGGDEKCLTNLTAGTYSVAVIDTAGCTATAEFTMTEPEKIKMEIVEFTHGSGSNGVIKLFVSGGVPPFNYTWTKDGAHFATTRDITGLYAGVYVLSVIDSRGCVITFPPFNLVPSNTVDFKVQKLAVWPNPAHAFIQMTVQNPLDPSARIEIMDIQGRTVLSQRVIGQGRELSIDISTLTEGSYMVRLISGNDLYQGKFVRFNN